MTGPRPPAPPSAEARAPLCAFRVGGEEYVLDLMRVREILPPSRITPVPRAPPFVEGVIHLRGAILPVVDLRRRLGLAAAAPTRKNRFLVCAIGPRRLGLVVDEVTEVLRIPRSEIRRAPALLSRGGPRFFLGVCGPPDRLRLLLNVKALLESAEPAPGAAEREAAREGALPGGSEGG